MNFNARVKLATEEYTSSRNTDLNINLEEYTLAVEEEREIREEIEADIAALEEAEDTVAVMQYYNDIYEEDPDAENIDIKRKERIVAAVEEARINLFNSMGRLGISTEDMPIMDGIKGTFRAISEFIKKVIDMMKSLINHVRNLLKKLIIRIKIIFGARTKMLQKVINFCSSSEHKNIKLQELDTNIVNYIDKLFHMFIVTSNNSSVFDIEYILNKITNVNYNFLTETKNIFTDVRNKYFEVEVDNNATAEHLKEVANRDEFNKKVIEVLRHSANIKNDLVYVTQVYKNSAKCLTYNSGKTAYYVSRYKIKRDNINKLELTANTLGDIANISSKVIAASKSVEKYYSNLIAIQDGILNNIKSLDKNIGKEINMGQSIGKIKRSLNSNIRAARTMSTNVIYDLVTQYTSNITMLTYAIVKIVSPYQTNEYKAKQQDAAKA